MRRRLSFLFGLLVAAVLGLVLEWVLFSRLGPLRAIFAQVSVLGVLAALGVVLARNLVHAGLFLVAFFFLIACQFVLLEAEFLAAMQVLVYIGAVSILLMFGIMLTRNVQGDETTSVRWPAKLPAALISFSLASILGYSVLAQRGGNDWTWSAATERTPIADPSGTLSPIGRAVSDMAPTLGVELMTRWVVPFELAGLLLTAALVGAVALARGHDDSAEPESGARAARPRASAGSPGGNGTRTPANPTPAPAATH